MAAQMGVNQRLLGTGGIRRILVALACLILISGASRAEDKPKYDVSVLAIRATTENNQISPELRPIAEQLRKETKYTGFKLERKQDGKVEQGKTFTAALVAGYQAKVTPTERKDSKIALTVEVTRQEDKQERRLLRTAVKINSGKYYLQGGSGWKLDSKSSDVLIVAVSAR
jgi:outer membrane translocation and assembly module TamA